MRTINVELQLPCVSFDTDEAALEWAEKALTLLAANQFRHENDWFEMSVEKCECAGCAIGVGDNER